MELWCKSKRWINTVILSQCLHLRDQLVFLSTQVEGQMLEFYLVNYTSSCSYKSKFVSRGQEPLWFPCATKRCQELVSV